MDEEQKRLDKDTISEKLAFKSGKTYWRSLDELSETEEFQRWLDDEFPHRASMPDVDRRSFLKLMGASVAMAALAGCRNLPQDKIIPYVKAPEERYPGQGLAYATAMTFAGYGFGLVVASSEGRPTKAEGNPDHPISLGSSDIFSQAELLQFYDPDRSQIPVENGYPSTWDDFTAAGRAMLSAHTADRGAGLRLLTETVTSPTLYAQIQSLLKAFPSAKWYQFNASNRDNERQGSQLAFGQMVDTHYDLTHARTILSLDGDILGCTPQNVKSTRDFMANRNPESGSLNRLYVIESTFSTTGSFADHRVAVKPSEVEDIARYIAAHLGVEGGPGRLPASVPTKWINVMVADLRSGGVVVTGERQNGVVHALVHAINHALGNVGKAVTYTAPVEQAPTIQYHDLAALAGEMTGGAVKTLLIVGGNPVYDAPADLKFAEALARVKNTVRLGQYQDETAQLCQWRLPESHFLEAWGDVRSYDGTTSIVQPLIAPLFDSRSAIEVISALLNKPQQGYDIVRATWAARLSEKDWRDALNRGTIANTAVASTTVALRAGFAAQRGAGRGGAMEASFAPDPTVYDGRYNNNGWLQELPKPLTKLTWDNAAILSPATAAKLAVVYQDVVEVSSNGGKITAPVFVLPGHPDDVVTLHIGYGREQAGKVGEGTGFNVNPLRSFKSPWMSAVEVRKTGSTYELATTQTHHSMEGRDIIREGDFEEYAKNPSFAEADKNEDREKDSILYNLTDNPDWKKADMAQWAMVIDLNTCTGCNSCVIACQAENNIPTVGKDQVQRGRAMHWIRVDRYFRVEEGQKERDLHEPISQVEAIAPTGDPAAMVPSSVKTVCMPVPCMHCETAPCEPVCPVAATIHSHEGLNQMVYNRCVGTRYCSNNCPYKVRRFNFFNYQFRYKNFQDVKDIPLLKMLNNPDVTVRGRGVMEKCTYCVQRINRARIEAKKEEREIRDGEVVPACAQACPSKSIIFGNMADAHAAVTKLKANKRNYSLLGDLNTRPRTTYLSKVRNINREIPV
jgi:MoCo/4Fe-4S cofactor protein with predicted Tat translocation signal